MFRPVIVLLTCLLSAPTTSIAQTSDGLDEVLRMPSYLPEQQVNGTLTFGGSRTMGPLFQLFAKDFQRSQSKAQFKILNEGSVEGLRALQQNKIDFVGWGRPLTEIQETTPDWKPGTIPIGHDPIAIIVNKSNPLKAITLQQFEAMLSANITWGELGVQGGLANAQTQLQRFKDSAGTVKLVANEVLKDKDYKASKEHETPTDMLKVVAGQPDAFGFLSASLVDASVKVLMVAERPNEYAVPTTDVNYPLYRTLYLLHAGEPETLSALHQEFLHYVLSQDGQVEAIKDGFLPLSRRELSEERTRLGWNEVQ